MKKISCIVLIMTCAQATLVEKIPYSWLHNTSFYAEDQGASMLLGQLFIRLDSKKMDVGRFLAELLILLHAEKKKSQKLEARIEALEHKVHELQKNGELS